MFVRDLPEVDFQNLFNNYSYGLVTHSPLAGGLLTDRFLQGITPKELDSLLNSFPSKLTEQFKEDPN